MPPRPAIVPTPRLAPHREKKMSDSAGKKDDAIPEKAKLVQEKDDDKMEDEEKILAGRDDVNIPALLTKDVPGG
jgi:hypothetical protein